MLARIKPGGEPAVREHAKSLDGWGDDIVLSRQAIDAAIATVPENVRQDIRYAHENIRIFAEAQFTSISEFET